MNSLRYLALFSCLVLFLTFRLLPTLKPEQHEHTSLPMPTHPWLATQPHVDRSCPEIAHDLAQFEQLCSHIAAPLLQKRTELEEQIPFNFPKTLYRALVLPDQDPAYKLYSRLYLGQQDLGLPLYLDIRVYAKTALEGLLASTTEQIGSAYFGELEAASAHNFTSHSKRGFFLYPKIVDDKLFVAYTEAPLSTIEVYRNLLIDLTK